MSNETFQMIIAGAVVLAFLSMIVQGLAALALYRTGKNMASRFAPTLMRAKAILAVEKDSIRRVEIAIDKALVFADIVERIAPRIGTLTARIESVGGRAIKLNEPLTELMRSVKIVETSSHFLVLDLRPRLSAASAETSALVRSATREIKRVSRVLRDAVGHFSHLRAVVASR